MAIPLTQRARSASEQQAIEPNLVFEIEGVVTLFGAVPIKKFVRIGDPDLEIGDPQLNENAFFIGGFNEIDDQDDLINFSATSTRISQQLNQDKGIGSSISSFDVGLVDVDESITKLIQPDENQSPAFDLLGRSCKVFLGFENTAWPDDYITIFRGPITDIISEPGLIKFRLNHPDNKKKAKVFKEVDTELNGAITSGATVLTVDDVSNILEPITGPDGTITPNFESYVLIDDEIIKFTGISGNQLTGLSRGAFNTTPASHDDAASVKTRYRLKGNVIDLALQLMLSGFDGPFLEDQDEITAFNVVDTDDIRQDTIFFKDVDVNREFGIVIGDFITTTGATNAANNVTLKKITGIDNTDRGDVLSIEGVSFVDETDTPAVIDFRSQYDVFPDGIRMRGDEVDVLEHLRLQRLFFSSFEYDFFLKETEDGKEFLERQIYSPIAAFSLPRKARASLGFHIGPIPGQNIEILSEENVKDPSNIRLNRSNTKNFFNEILYRFDEDRIEDRFLAGQIVISQTSKNRIVGGAKALEIDARGLRTVLQGASIALSQANRRLDRYQFGAESLMVKTTFSVGFPIEIGDIVVLDGSGLKISDKSKGSRDFDTRLMEVTNKTLDISGEVSLELTDTNFDGQGRFALISPASRIKSGISANEFVIESSFASRFGDNEFQKWDKYLTGAPEDRPNIKVRNADFSTIGNSIIVGISGNVITVSPALPFTPSAGMIMELQDYDDPDPTPQKIKLVFGFMTDNAQFPDGEDQYQML